MKLRLTMALHISAYITIAEASSVPFLSTCNKYDSKSVNSKKEPDVNKHAKSPTHYFVRQISFLTAYVVLQRPWFYLAVTEVDWLALCAHIHSSSPTASSLCIYFYGL